MLDYGFFTLLLLIVSVVAFNVVPIALKVLFPEHNWPWALLALGLIVETFILRIANSKNLLTGDVPNDDALLLVIVTAVSIAAMAIVQKIVGKSKKGKGKESV